MALRAQFKPHDQKVISSGIPYVIATLVDFANKNCDLCWIIKQSIIEGDLDWTQQKENGLIKALTWDNLNYDLKNSGSNWLLCDKSHWSKYFKAEFG